MGESKTDLIRVLVVDDDPAIGGLIGDIGSVCGFSVTVVSDPFRFEEFYSDELNLLVVDLNMPGRSGIEILRSLDEIGSKVPLLLMSGIDNISLQDAGEQGRASSLRVLGEIQKPFRVQEFTSAVGTILCRDDA